MPRDICYCGNNCSYLKLYKTYLTYIQTQPWKKKWNTDVAGDIEEYETLKTSPKVMK